VENVERPNGNGRKSNADMRSFHENEDLHNVPNAQTSAETGAPNVKGMALSAIFSHSQP